MSGTPGGTRIPNLLIRSQTLYPIELRVRCARHGRKKPDLVAGVKDFRRIGQKRPMGSQRWGGRVVDQVERFWLGARGERASGHTAVVGRGGGCRVSLQLLRKSQES